MGVSVVVNSQNFVREVIDPSFQCPVLVDFFATWCGPCQMLKPILESLTLEYDFVLAKLDIDQNQSLAQRYGIEGVPDVRIVKEGKMFPGFVGVLPEPQIRSLLQGLGLTSKLEAELITLKSLAQTETLEDINQHLENLLKQYPDRPEVLVTAAELYQQQHRLDEALELLGRVNIKDKAWYQKASGLKSLMELERLGQEDPETEHDRTFQLAVQAVLDQQYENALEGFLGIVSQDRKYRQDGARKSMLLLFDLLGDDHELTRTYRKKLTRILY